MSNLEFLTSYLQESTRIKKQKLMSIAIISYNRLHYLRALIKSLIQSQDISILDVFIVDNCSDEEGFDNFFDTLTKHIRVIRQKSTFAEAMNIALSSAQTGHICFLPDDVQFIRNGSEWVYDCLELFSTIENAGSICIDSQRRPTVKKYFSFLNNPFGYVFKGLNKNRFYSYGDKKIGLTPSGLNSVFRLSDLITLGGWPHADRVKNDYDASDGAEQAMIDRIKNSIHNTKKRFLFGYPVIADIYTDKRGCSSKIRKGRRLYEYFRAEDDLYYEIRTPKTPKKIICSEDCIKPIGFKLAYDKQGNLIKAGS